MALIELRQQNKVPDTIRFLRFPPTALLGRHQDLSHEINLDYCAENGIGTVRRITGGGAIYLDEGQLGWELVFHRKSLGITKLPCLAREICNAAAAGLGELGVNAKFRPRNDIEVDGRKISGTGGFFDGEVLIYQGTVLVDMNPAKMVKALNIPAAKVAKHNLDTAEQRVVTLKELLGDDRSRVSLMSWVSPPNPARLLKLRKPLPKSISMKKSVPTSSSRTSTIRAAATSCSKAHTRGPAGPSTRS
jgi:lipoate-protein ligase A